MGESWNLRGIACSIYLLLLGMVSEPPYFGREMTTKQRMRLCETILAALVCTWCMRAGTESTGAGVSVDVEQYAYEPGAICYDARRQAYLPYNADRPGA